MLKIKTWRDPYDAGFSTTRPREIAIEEGLTVLVGCNGAGKTTLLRNIAEECRTQGIPTESYDNLRSGGGMAKQSAFGCGNWSLGAALYSSSEGEAVKLNFGNMVSRVRKFLETGFYDNMENRISRILDKGENPPGNKRVLLFDAIDSGLSVDSVAEIRSVFDLILDDAKRLGVEVYIVASANEYELARCAPCFDVSSGRYIPIKSYEEYRSFVLESRRRKDRREERSAKVMEKRREREEAEGQARKAEEEKCGRGLEKKRASCVRKKLGDGKGCTFPVNMSISIPMKGSSPLSEAGFLEDSGDRWR